MMRLLVFFIALICFLGFGVAVAQHNLTPLYNQHWNLAGGRLIPSKIGLDYSRLQVFVLGTHAYAANNSVALGPAGRINSGNAASVADRLKFRTHVGIGREVEVLSIAYKFIRRKKERLTLALNASERMAVSSAFPGDLGRYLIRGNALYAGEVIKVQKMEMSAWHLRDFGLAFVKPVNTSLLNRMLQLRFAGRAKFVQGFAGAHLPATDGTLFTEQDGRYIDIQSDYRYHTAGIQGWQMDNVNNPVNGYGFGGDLSVTGNFANLVRGSISVIDIGRVQFTENTRMYERTGTLRYEGQVSDNFLTGASGQFDTLLTTAIRGVETSGQSFTMQLPTRLIVQGEFVLDYDPNRKGNREYSDKKYDKKYDKHVVYLTYIQGFNRMPGNTVRPLISTAYAYSWGSFLNVGGNISYGGFATLGVGGFVSLRVGPVRAGVGSSNFLGAAFPNQGRGADYTFNLAFAF